MSSKASKAITMDKLTGRMCKWPVGDPRDKNFHFCGRRRIDSRSYCDEHMEVAYRSAQRPKSA